MDPLSITASMIAIIGGMSTAYTTIKKIAGLPKAFDKARDEFPFMQSIFRHVQNRLIDGQQLSDEESKATLAIINPCHDKAKELKRIFDEIEAECRKDQEAKDWARIRVAYQKALRGIKAHRVECLMKDILEGLQKLALSQSFMSTMQKDLKGIEEAIKAMSKVEPSLADSEFESSGIINASQTVAGEATAQQNNVQGGVNTFQSGKYIGGTHFHNTSPGPVQEEKKVEWLERLYSCRYRDRKDVNPPRVEGTCEWFTSHPLFQNWQQSNTASLLWVSADPGCGKSVLAKYLVDDVLQSTDMRTTCYFFFKDGFDDQKSSTTALCCILRQILKQRPDCFSDQILRKLEEDKRVEKGEKKPPPSFRDLWDLFMVAAGNHKTGEIVCIIDALDECEESGRNQLIDAISNFHSHATPRTSILKFLLTSRPYQGIVREFSQHLERELPTIHLSGESAEEARKISREIDLVVRNRIADDGGRLGLTQEEQNVLREELTRVPNHTYLWVYLIFDIINDSIIDRAEDIRSIAKTIPKTVEAAYDRILSKSPDIERARKILHIIVAAARPLTLEEMDLALAIGPKHRSISELELVPETRFRENIRQHCGLFIVVVDSKIYLLHQTAREFLVPSLPSEPPLSPPSGPKLQWKFSLHPGESNRILAEICMQRLSLSDFNLKTFQANKGDRYIAKRTLLGYSAQYWAEHFREGDWNSGDWTIEKATKKALSHLNPQRPASLAWFEIYQMLTTKERPENFTPLIIASYFGHNTVVQQLLEAGAELNAKENYGSTPLHWASSNGHNLVVQQLLEAGAEVDAKDNDHRTPLHRASWNGHDLVVQQLLEAGAEVDAKDDNDHWTPLHRASWNGHDLVVQQLLEAGAEVDAKDDNDDWTPLHRASWNGHDLVVQQLLEAGAEVDAKDNDHWTPLHRASWNGHDLVVQQLLEAGAEVDAKENYGSTPLHRASSNGHDLVVQQLLEAGAELDAKDNNRRTPLLRGFLEPLLRGFLEPPRPRRGRRFTGLLANAARRFTGLLATATTSSYSSFSRPAPR